MSQSIRQLTPEELLLRTNWVRRLARGLARDSSSADDLAQDVLLRQIEHPPVRLKGPQDWFTWTRVATKNSSLSQQRKRRLRETVEVENAPEPSDSLPTPVEILEMEDERQELVELVRGLPEPLLGVVLLHYFEDISVQQIADQLGAPLKTVRSRLQRGLELLRAELKNRKGPDWRNYCLALAAPVGFEGASQLGLGGLGGAKLLLVGALLVAGGAALWSLVGQERESDDALVHEVASANPTGVPALARGSDGPRGGMGATAGGRSAQSGSGAETLVTDPAGILVHGTVRDESGLPVGADRVVFRSESETTRGSTLGGRAFYAVAELSPGSYTAEALLAGTRSRPLKLTLGDQPVVELDLVLERPALVPLRLTDARHEPYAQPLVRTSGLAGAVRLEWLVTRGAPAAAGPQRDVLEARFEVRQRVAPELQALLGEDALGLLSVPSRPPFHVSALVGEYVVATTRVATAGDEAHLEVSAADVERLSGTVELVVLDELSRAPLAGVQVEVVGGGNTRVGRSDADGGLELTGVLPGAHELRLNAKDHAPRRLWIEVEAGETSQLGELELGPRSRLSGMLLDEAGRPVAGSITILALSELDARSGLASSLRARSDASGHFELRGAPDEPLLLVPAPYASRWARTAQRVDAGAGDVRGVVFTLHRGRRVGLQLTSEHEPTAYRILHDGLPVELGLWGDGPQLDLRLVPGRYVARSEDAQGRTLGERPFEVREGSADLIELEL